MADKIFINYRRDDRAAHATLIRDRLAPVYGAATIFMDVANLLPGEHFAERLEKELAGCDVLIAVIGPRWLELLDARLSAGVRDYVREEIATALKRRIIVIPVLVDNAQLPPADRLPEDLQSLVLYQKHVLNLERVDRDATELIAAIDAVREKMRPVPAPNVSPPQTSKIGTPWVRPATIAAVVLLIAGGAGIGAWKQGLMDKPTKPPEVASTPAPKVPDPATVAENEGIGAARASKTIQAFENYLTKVRTGALKGTFREEARRSIADLERWDRTDKSSTEALTAYLKTIDKPLMATEANSELAALIDKAEREACEAYASSTLAQVDQAKALACTVSGDRWSARKVVQLDQCTELKTPEARSAEARARLDTLTQCQNDKVEKEAWAKLEAGLAATTVPQAAPKGTKPVAKKESGPAVPPELASLRDQIKSQTAKIAMIEAFIAANPNGADGKYSAKAHGTIEDRARQRDEAKAKILEFDRAMWAEAEKTPMKVDGFSTYLAVFPDGEHSKAEVDAIIADIGVCEATRKTDDVVAMKAYREKFPQGRCSEDFAKLIAPPTDLTGAKLVIAEPPITYPLDLSEKPRIIGLKFSEEGNRLLIASNFGERKLVDFDLTTSAISEPPKSIEFLPLNYADLQRVVAADIKMLAVLRRGRVAGLFDSRWLSIFTDASGNGTDTSNANSSFAWFEDGVIRVQEAEGKSILRSFPIKEKDAKIPRIAMSPDGRFLAARIEWSDEQKSRSEEQCKGDYDPPMFRGDRITKTPARDFGICTVKRYDVRVYSVLEGTSWSFEPMKQMVVDAYKVIMCEIDGVPCKPSKHEASWAAFSVDFSEDGSRILVGHKDRGVRIHDVQKDGQFNRRPTFEIVTRGGELIRRVLELPSQKNLLLVETDGHEAGSPFSIYRSNAGSEDRSGVVSLTIPSAAPDAITKDVVARAITDGLFAATGLESTTHMWAMPSGRYLAWLKHLPNGAYVTGTPSGAFTMSGNAEPHLVVEIGKRRWPLADVPAFKAKFYRKDGINLLEPPP